MSPRVVDWASDRRARFAESNCRVLRLAKVAAPRLSVVIPSYNTSRFVVDAVQSILTQSMPDVEVIVVDDGSSDDSVLRVSSIDDTRLTIVAQTNQGLAGARNTGVALARSRFVGLCDSDDVWYPRKAELHLELMERRPDVGLSYSYSEYLSEAGERTGRFLITKCTRPSARDMVVRNHVGNGSTPVLRRKALLLAGPFDQSLVLYEDHEMWIRLLATTPFKAELIPEVLTGYRVRRGSLSVSFGSYLRGDERAISKYLEHIPSLTEREVARCRSEILRISSRKAFEDGQLALSRTLFADALRHTPTLMLHDARAAGLAVLQVAALLPARLHRPVYAAMQRMASIAFHARRSLRSLRS